MVEWHLPGKDVEHVRQALEQFSKTLKTFINETCFDYNRFGAHSKNLTRIISVIRNRADSISRGDELSVQLGSVVGMFQNMKRVVELYKKFDNSSNPLHCVVREILWLHIGVLALFNSHGAIDFQFKDFGLKVIALCHLVGDWEIKYSELKNVPAQVKFICEAEALRTRKLLVELYHQIPKERSDEPSGIGLLS